MKYLSSSTVQLIIRITALILLTFFITIFLSTIHYGNLCTEMLSCDFSSISQGPGETNEFTNCKVGTLDLDVLVYTPLAYVSAFIIAAYIFFQLRQQSFFLKLFYNLISAFLFLFLFFYVDHILALRDPRLYNDSFWGNGISIRSLTDFYKVMKPFLVFTAFAFIALLGPAVSALSMRKKEYKFNAFNFIRFFVLSSLFQVLVFAASLVVYIIVERIDDAIWGAGS